MPRRRRGNGKEMEATWEDAKTEETEDAKRCTAKGNVTIRKREQTRVIEKGE